MSSIRKKTFRGREFLYTETTDRNSWWTFDDEDAVRERWWHIQPGDVILDVGAGFGSYALPALALGASKVYCFNPAFPDMCLLTANLVANTGFRERAILLDYGLHRQAGFFDWRVSRLYPDHAPDRLPVRTFHDFLSDHPDLDRVDWLKLDIEGAELHALQAGGAELITRFRPKLLIENHLFHDPGIEAGVVDFINGLGLGYRVQSQPYHSVSHTFAVCK